MENLNHKLSVLPTERDFSILKSLYDNVVMSFAQITKLHFADRSKPTIVNRLTKLEKGGYIQRWRIPRLMIPNTQGVISVVFQITKFGIQALQKQYPELDFKPEPIRIRPFSVDHDLLLVDVILAIKNKFPDCKSIHGELYYKNQSHIGLKPDAILIQPCGNSLVAIELE